MSDNLRRYCAIRQALDVHFVNSLPLFEILGRLKGFIFKDSELA